MPKVGNFIASIKVDKNEVPEYDVQVDDSEKLVSCWVPSETGKTFSVCWQSLEPLATDTAGYVTIDGIPLGGRISYGGSNTVKVEFSGYVTATTCCDLIFSQIAYTDDDAYLNTSIANIGEIKLEVWSVVVGEVIPPPTRTVTSDVKVHERSKKLGSHHVKFDDPKAMAPRNHYNTTGICKLATCIFTYRPLDILQANGIAPLPASAEQGKGNNKRKTLEDDVDIKEETSGDEDDDDDDDIDDRVRKLKDKLRRLESRRAKKRMVKVKKEDRPPIINEVIDLT